MAQRLTFTESAITEIIESLRKRLGQVIPSGGVNITKSNLPNQKAEIIFSAKAYAKICSLVHQYTTEVEWEGFVERRADNIFFIKDIVVFPHTVTAATVTADQEEYEAWLDTLTDEQINTKHFHGHSHVNMGVTPSSVDMEYREKRVSALPKAGIEGNDSFAIFMIINKRSEMEFQIYDVEKNVFYLCPDITYDIEWDGELASNFVADARTKAKERTATTVTASSVDNSYLAKYGYYDSTGKWHSYASEGKKDTSVTKPYQPHTSNKPNTTGTTTKGDDDDDDISIFEKEDCHRFDWEQEYLDRYGR